MSSSDVEFHHHSGAGIQGIGAYIDSTRTGVRKGVDARTKRPGSNQLTVWGSVQLTPASSSGETLIKSDPQADVPSSVFLSEKSGFAHLSDRATSPSEAY